MTKPKDKDKDATEATVNTAAEQSQLPEKTDPVATLAAEQNAKASAESAKKEANLTARLATANKSLADATAEVESLKDEVARLKKENASLRSKMEGGDIATLDLQKGEAQLKESVTILVEGNRVCAKAGDVLVSSKSSVEAVQAKLGETNRVHVQSAADIKELVADGFAIGNV